MRKFGTWSWPILMVSDQLRSDTDQGAWFRAVVECLTDQRECTVQQSHTLADASEAVRSQENLGAIVLDWDISEIGQPRARNQAFKLAATADEGSRRSLPAEAFIRQVRERNAQIPIVVLIGTGLNVVNLG
jgi:Orn/Lys/Arg decarboxylase, N-terminal domain